MKRAERLRWRVLDVERLIALRSVLRQCRPLPRRTLLPETARSYIKRAVSQVVTWLIPDLPIDTALSRRHG